MPNGGRRDVGTTFALFLAHTECREQAKRRAQDAAATSASRRRNGFINLTGESHHRDTVNRAVRPAANFPLE